MKYTYVTTANSHADSTSQKRKLNSYLSDDENDGTHDAKCSRTFIKTEVNENLKINEIKSNLESAALKHQKSIDATSMTTISISLNSTECDSQIQSQLMSDSQTQEQQPYQLIESYQIDNLLPYLLTDDTDEPKNSTIYSYARDNPQIRIECGSIFDVEPVGAIVNSIDPNFTFNGSFAKMLLDHCGRDTVTYSNNYGVPLAFDNTEKTYEIRVTSAGNLKNAKWILNICFRSFEFITNEPEIHFKNTIKKLLKYCIDNDISSIALPPLGTGLLGYPASYVVKWLHECFNSFFLSYTCHSMQKIIIVLPSETPQSNIFAQFFNELDNCKPAIEGN